MNYFFVVKCVAILQLIAISCSSPLDMRDAARCFNCSSYSHSLKECTKPYNNAVVNNARKEYQFKKSKNSGPRVRTRYYQDSPAGKYDGLKPGCLAPETRELLGLKVIWLIESFVLCQHGSGLELIQLVL